MKKLYIRLIVAFCWCVTAVFGRIPRYGRVYTLGKDMQITKQEWHFFRHGFWDITILGRLGLLWFYVEYLEAKQAAKEAR